MFHDSNLERANKLFKPHEYQLRALDFLENNKRAALFLPLGAGKTSISLSYISKLLESGESKGILIIAPKSVVFGTWQQEISKWNNFNHLTSTILHGANKVSNYNKDFDIYITNFESLKWLNEEVIKTKKLKFDTIIIDESSRVKSWRSQRTKLVQKFANSVVHVILLSGTPSPNSYLDIFSQYRILDKGLRLGHTITGYKKKYFNTVGWQFPTYELKENAKEQIVTSVSDITFRIDESELPYVPHLKENIIYFDLSKKVMKQYNELEKNMFLELNEVENGIEVSSAVALTNKCRQFTSGFLYHENENTLIREVIEIHTEKLEYLKDIVETLQGEPVIIAYNFKYELEMINLALKNYNVVSTVGANLADIEKRWNNKEIEILLIQPMSVSHGLNLQKGGHNIVWYSLTYMGENYTQLIARLNRQGQTNCVKNHILIANNTIDLLVLDSLHSKNDKQQTLLDTLYNYQKTKETS